MEVTVAKKQDNIEIKTNEFLTAASKMYENLHSEIKKYMLEEDGSILDKAKFDENVKDEGLTASELFGKLNGEIAATWSAYLGAAEHKENEECKKLAVDISGLNELVGQIQVKFFGGEEVKLDIEFEKASVEEGFQGLANAACANVVNAYDFISKNMPEQIEKYKGANPAKTSEKEDKLFDAIKDKLNMMLDASENEVTTEEGINHSNLYGHAAYAYAILGHSFNNVEIPPKSKSGEEIDQQIEIEPVDPSNTLKEVFNTESEDTGKDEKVPEFKTNSEIAVALAEVQSSYRLNNKNQIVMPDKEIITGFIDYCTEFSDTVNEMLVKYKQMVNDALVHPGYAMSKGVNPDELMVLVTGLIDIQKVADVDNKMLNLILDNLDVYKTEFEKYSVLTNYSEKEYKTALMHYEFNRNNKNPEDFESQNLIPQIKQELIENMAKLNAMKKILLDTNSKQNEGKETKEENEEKVTNTPQVRFFMQEKRPT